MRFSTLTFKNLTRNRRRTVLTLLAIGLPLCVFTIARSMVDAVDRFLEESDRNLRVAVHHKLNFTASLPVRIRGEIEDLAPDGYIKAVCGSAWFGGRLEGEQMTFPSFGVHRDTFAIAYSEFGMTDDDAAMFERERRAAVVAPALAKRMNWSVGDKVTLLCGIPPNPEMDFVIVSIPPDMDYPALYMAYDYYDEVWREKAGRSRGINNFWIKCNHDEARKWALTAIDKHFANTEHETRSEMESTFVAGFTKMGGDWVSMIWQVGLLVVLVAVAAAFNTMSSGFRERTREYALLRALGFQRGRVVRLVLSEGLLLGILGGILGVGLPWLVATMLAIEIPGAGIFTIEARTLQYGAAVSVACGFAAALIPAVMAGRLRVAPALRKVV